jgi:hypothetical protein
MRFGLERNEELLKGGGSFGDRESGKNPMTQTMNPQNGWIVL